jgi:putative transposase
MKIGSDPRADPQRVAAMRDAIGDAGLFVEAKLAALMDDSEHDVLAYMTFPAQHRTKLHSTNPLERLNKEVKRRADVVGIFPNEASITRLIGAVLLEQNDEWLLQGRYMQIEGMAELKPPALDTEAGKLPPLAA